MKRVLNYLLGISFFLFLGMAVFVYLAYQRSQKTDITLLERNTIGNENPVNLKDGRVDEISVNMIFYTSQDQNELHEVAIEVFNRKLKTLNYLILPADTYITVEKSLYQKMTVVYPEMPQYFRLRQVMKLFDKKKRFGYAQIILDHMLSIDSSSYTVVCGEEATFQEYQEKFLNGESSGKEWGSVLFRDTISNLKSKEQQQYMEAFALMTAEDFSYEMVVGTETTNQFEIDLVQWMVRIQQLLHGE